jgi:hypothetical protein
MWNSRKLFAEVVKNWPAKALSVGLALLLVVFHQMSSLEERFFSVPLKVEGGGSLSPTAPYARPIRVSLRGDPNEIYPIVENDIEVFIDLSPYTEPGTYRVPVQVRKKGSALGIEPLEISLDPLEISLELDRRVSKTVPLTPNFQGAVESGYELVSYTLLPAQVDISGPEKVVGTISELSTGVIDLDKRQEDFSLRTAVLNGDPLVSIRGEGAVEFRGAIREQVVLREFDNIPIALANLDLRFAARPDRETGIVRLQGGRRGLGNYDPPEDFLSLDCSSIRSPGTYTLPVAVNIASFFNLEGWEPEQVNVFISPFHGGQP